MTPDDLVSVLIPSTFALFLVIERLVPGQAQPRVRWWFLKGLGFFLLVGAMNAIIPALVLEAIDGYSVLHLSNLGTVGGAILVLLAGDLITYWIHRGMHNNDLVWRWTHQLHHSAERMDMLGASYFHPLDFLLQNVLPSVALMILLGLSPEAAALGGYLGFVLGVFPHLNVRTPKWLGYALQRPEMHALHHTRGVHAYNYGNLAFSDLLFGTWRNPAEFPAEPYGFWDGASARLGAMLLGRSVASPSR